MSTKPDGANEKAKMDNRSRLKEITGVLRRNKVTRGVSPEKLRVILEELGPTYIKLGQIMSLHSDILPKAYCDELMKLNSEVTPMPFSEVEEVINRSYRMDWHEVFENIEKDTLGSASIAQVHRATLKTGEDVIVKVQRKGIYDTMARDIGLLHRAVKLMPNVGNLKNMVDLDMVLDEMWSVAQEEMDFLKEASNMEEFARNNKDIKYVYVPKLYNEYTTTRVLVMEYIDGCSIDDKEALLAGGYDLEEVGRKFVNNYIKQVMDDGFFHADPHPGNVKVRDGKIVWIDMGMMGRLNDHDRMQMVKGVEGIALSDISMIEDAVMELGEFWGEPDRGRLYSDLRELVDQYGRESFVKIDIAQFFADLMEIMKANYIRLPHGVTMLVRGLTHVQGDLIKISPDINMMEIAQSRMREHAIETFDLRKELEKNGKLFYRAFYNALEIPPLAEDALEEYLKGQAQVRLNLDATQRFTDEAHHLVRNLVMGMWVMALLLSSSILCMTDMKPRFFGIPIVGMIGYFMAFIICLYIFVKHFMLTRGRKRNNKKRKK